MTVNVKETAQPGSEEAKPGTSTLMARFRDKARWRKSLIDTGLWFMAGVALTSLLSFTVPGRPIIVGSNSIPAGVYWLDTQNTSYAAGDYASFPFKPSQDWLRVRYGTDRVFTKQVLGVAGDTIYADAQKSLKICKQTTEGAPTCKAAGTPQVFDSVGRPMSAWIEANHQYTLKAGEVWMYGTNTRSLDSRYYGPVNLAMLYGKATPLFIWD